MSRSKSFLIFICVALGFGFTQSALAQWWPATGTDTNNEWGGGGWGSNVEIYIDQAPLKELKAPDPDCTLKPKDCKDPANFKHIFNPGDGSGLLVATAPILNGLRLEPAVNCANPPNEYNATIRGSGHDAPPSIAVCIIRDDAGNLLPETAAYCSVDVGVNDVIVSNPGGECVYERTIGDLDAGEWQNGAGIFTEASSVKLHANLEDAHLPANDPDVFPELEPENVPTCGTPQVNQPWVCTLDVGLPAGVICPAKGQPKCRSNLFPSTELFAEGQVLLAREDRNIVALRYCVSDVNGGRTTINCNQGDKQVETAEADVVILCSASHSPAKDTLNSTGSNTHKFDYLADCFPELDSEGVTTSGTIEFETVANDVVTSPSAANPARIEPANECQFGGDTANPSKLTCFVPETRLVEGCQQTCKFLETDSNDPKTGCVDEIRGRAVVNVEGNDVPLIAIDDNGGNGFLCKL